MTDRTPPTIMGNWKMNLDRAAAESLATSVARVASGHSGQVDVSLLPPFPYLSAVKAALAGSKVTLGAQDLHWETAGAFTGAVSGSMLKDLDCRHVLVGHSERRALFGDDDHAVTRKLRAALASDLIPVLCVGESLEARDHGRAWQVVQGQLDAALADLATATVQTVVVAYEPVWAIGTGRVATPAQAAEIHEAIHQHLGAGIRVLYGGSASPDNATELLAEASINGLLVGSAALRSTTFEALIKQAATAAA